MPFKSITCEIDFSGMEDEGEPWTPAVLGSERNKTERLMHDIRNHTLIGCNAPEMVEWAQRHGE